MLKACLLVALLTAGCASAPPAGLYTPVQQRIYVTENLEQAVLALSTTAIHLNAMAPPVVSDADARVIRDFALTVDATRVTYATGTLAGGTSLLATMQTAFMVLNMKLSPDVKNTTLKAVLGGVSLAIAAIPPGVF